MNKFLLYIMIASVLSFTVLAQEVALPQTVLLGGTGQERGENATTTLVLSNTGNTTVTGMTLVASSGSAYQVLISGVPSSLAAGEQVTVTISGNVPLSLDAVDSDGEEMVHGIGTLTLSGSAGGSPFSDTANLQMQAESKLRIQRFYVNGDRMSDGDEVEDLRPGDELELRMQIESRFNDRGDCEDDGQNCDIEDIEAGVIADDGDVDIDEEFDFSDIEPEEDLEDTLTVEIDSDAEDDNYEMEIYVVGEDENGARHGERFSIELQIDRPRDEVQITDWTFTPATLECNERVFEARVTVENTGRSDQDKVTLDVENRKLEILESIGRIELDEGDDTVKTFNIRLPQDTAPGDYYFDIIAFYDNNEESDRQTQKVSLRECQAELPEEQPEAEDNSTTEVEYIDFFPPPGGYTGQPQEPETPSTYLIMLGAGFAVMLILILVLLFLIVKKR